MSKCSTELLVEVILESAAKILKYTDVLSFEQFLADDHTKDTVVRNFEVIGAAGRLFNEFRQNHFNIDW